MTNPLERVMQSFILQEIVTKYFPNAVAFLLIVGSNVLLDLIKKLCIELDYLVRGVEEENFIVCIKDASGNNVF